ncbi:MAG: OmpA family protein [Spirochaetales bacterium]|nr:OmpA family protein [Spirochaetales bacterium]
MNKNLVKALSVVILFTASIVSAQAQHVEELYSPFFFGLGPQTSSMEAPVATAYNPAAAALEQRIRLDLNYLALIGSDANTGGGSVINAGVSLPTNFGVFSFQGNYTGSDLQSANYGSLGGLHVAFSKDLLPNLLVGLSVSGIFGEQAGSTDWGLGADIGAIYLLGKLAFLEDVAIGASIRNMGKGYVPNSSTSDYFPAAFTPAASISMKMFKSEPFSWTLYADVSSPTCSNILFYAGTEFEIFQTFTARASYKLDVNEILNNNNTRFPFTFGFSVNFKIDLEENVEFLTERGWSKSDIKVNGAFAPLSDSAFALGGGVNIALGLTDNKPPQVNLSPVKPESQAADDETVYVSPNLDGTQDNLDLPVSISDERYVKGYKLVIKNEKGDVVRTIENKEYRPENLELDNVVNRLLYVKEGVKVPETISWDGKNDNGAVVPDGKYTYEVEAWDDNGNRGTTPAKPVVIDSVPPKAEIKASYTIFSPNNDGNKDSLPLKLSGSAEDSWKGEVADSTGKVVNTFEWKGQPQDFAWDGKDSGGKLLSDGVYSVALSSTDRAGNASTRKFDNIIINTQETPIFITVDKTVFSPNSDGVVDTVDFNVILGNPDGISSWTLEIVHEKNGVERKITGTGKVGETVSWDGKKDDRQTADEGLYTARLTVEYVKGDKPVASSKGFRLDISAPVVDIAFSPDPFSPDNDGVEDELYIKSAIEEASGIDSWTMEITDPKGKHFNSFTGKGTPSTSIVWDGLSDDGELVQAASDYTLTMAISDTVGNKASFKKVIAVDVLVIRDGDKLYIRVPSITFKPDTADYKAVAKEALEKNMWTLDRLARIFKKYKNYNILIEGHAVSVYWKDKVRAEQEQVEELIPLAKKRAEAIKQALGTLGIDETRISTVGVGASRPIVPFSDEENLWKNRRVEFILLK